MEQGRNRPQQNTCEKAAPSKSINAGAQGGQKERGRIIHEKTFPRPEGFEEYRETDGRLPPKLQTSGKAGWSDNYKALRQLQNHLSFPKAKLNVHNVSIGNMVFQAVKTRL
jgi:hypothetical protein